MFNFYCVREGMEMDRREMDLGFLKEIVQTLFLLHLAPPTILLDDLLCSVSQSTQLP